MFSGHSLAVKNLKRFVVDAAPDAASPLARHHAGVRRATDTLADPESSLAALPVLREAPPHGRLDALAGLTLGGVILPIGRAGAHGTDWIVCRAPGGPALGTGLSFRGDAAGLTQRVARSAAGALARLDRAGFTHRAVNPLNVFPSHDGGVELGPFWSTPPAFNQSAVFEPAASASSHRAGRGPGTIADDVYALGVTLLALFVGEVPLADLSDEEVVERKLWQGSAAALTRPYNLPGALAELIGAMISDDPFQRPRPERIEGNAGTIGPNASSRRRINAALPLVIGTREVWTTTQLNWTMATHGDAVLRALLTGQVEAWLRRGLNEIVLAERVENLGRPTGRAAVTLDGKDAEALFLAKVGHLLDPQSPLTWKGMRFLPDGLPGLLGAALGGADEKFRALVGALLESGAAGPQSCAARGFALDRPRASTRFATIRLLHELNPSAPCLSAAIRGHHVVAIDDLLRALDEVSVGAPGPPLDGEMLAFIAAKQRSPVLTGELADERAQLRVLAHFATEFRAVSLPAVARRLAGALLHEVESWPGVTGRARRQARIEQVIRSGDLPALHDMAIDRAELARERDRQREAHGRIAVLRAQHEALSRSAAARARDARRFGREAAAIIATGAGALVLLLSVLG